MILNDLTKFSDVKSIHKRFLRFAYHKNGTPKAFENHDFSRILAISVIDKLKSIHLYHDISFVLKNSIGNSKYTKFNVVFSNVKLHTA